MKIYCLLSLELTNNTMHEGSLSIIFHFLTILFYYLAENNMFKYLYLVNALNL